MDKDKYLLSNCENDVADAIGNSNSNKKTN